MANQNGSNGAISMQDLLDLVRQQNDTLVGLVREQGAARGPQVLDAEGRASARSYAVLRQALSGPEDGLKIVSPRIVALIPEAASVGSELVILMQSGGRPNDVQFVGAGGTAVAAEPKPRSTRDRVVVQVPAGAESGPVTVTTSAGDATSASSFDVRKLEGPIGVAYVHPFMEVYFA